MLTENDIKKILSYRHRLSFDEDAVESFEKNFDYSIFNFINMVNEKSELFTEKEWDEIVDGHKDNSSLLYEIARTPNFPKTAFLKIVENLKILDEFETKITPKEVAKEEDILKLFFERNLGEEEHKKIVERLLPVNLSHIFSDTSYFAKRPIENNFVQSVLKMALEKAIDSYVALPPNSLEAVHNFDELLLIKDFEYLKSIMERHFEHKENNEYINGYRDLISETGRFQLVHNPYLDPSKPEHKDLICQAFYNDRDYKSNTKNNIDISILKLNRPIDYIVNDKFESIISELNKTNIDLEDISDINRMVDWLFYIDALDEKQELILFENVKDKENCESIMITLLNYCKNDVVIDYIPNLPLEQQVNVISSRDDTPPDILKLFFRKYLAENEEVASLKERELSPSIKGREFMALEKSIKKTTFTNAEYDFYFNFIDVKKDSLLRILEKPNAIPENYMKSIIDKNREIYKKEEEFKIAQVVIGGIINLYSRSSALPETVLNEIKRISERVVPNETVDKCLTKFKFAYDNLSSLKTYNVLNILNDLNVNNKEELIAIFTKVSDDIKKISNQVNSNTVLPFETAFADFLVEHVSKLCELLELQKTKSINDFEEFKYLSTKDMSKIEMSYSDLLWIWPDPHDAKYDTMPEYADLCRELNEEGTRFLDFVKAKKEIEYQDEKVKPIVNDKDL